MIPRDSTRIHEEEEETSKTKRLKQNVVIGQLHQLKDERFILSEYQLYHPKVQIHAEDKRSRQGMI